MTQRISMMPVLGRVAFLCVVLLLAWGAACSWYCGGITWLYDYRQEYSPFLGCPEFVLGSGGINSEGPTCRVSLMYNESLAIDLAESGSLSTVPGVRSPGTCSLSRISNPEFIECYRATKCSSLCNRKGTTQPCPDSSTLVDPRTVFERIPLPQCVVSMDTPGFLQLPCFYVSLYSYCDQDFIVTPANEITIRGIFVASLVIVVIWIFAELILRSVEMSLKAESEQARTYHQETLPSKRAHLSAILEQRLNNDPDLFMSRAWRRRLEQYRSLREERISSFQSRAIIRSITLYFFYFIMMVITLYVVLWVSPQHISQTQSSSSRLWFVFVGQISFWNIHSALDLIVFADILLDFGLFVIAALCVDWPRAPVFSRHLKQQMDSLLSKAEIEEGIDDQDTDGGILDISTSSLNDTQSLSFVLRQSPVADCCLLIACHESTLTFEKAKSFAQTLQKALLIFPPSHVFVCDNGNSMPPVDDTQIVARSVHPDINYVYIPEGNKTFAFYWCNRYWIPFLERAGVVPKFTYAMIIDDDVPLPSDLHIPHEQLRLDPNIKAVHFPITAVGPENTTNLLVRFQDLEYKLAAVHKQFQALISRCLSCHGAVALWEREAMENVFYAHDTVFHGEDMMMGLCLLKQRDKSKIVSAAQTVVPTYAPSNFRMLFRQRVKSWELTSHRKTLTYLGELLNPRSFCHVPSLVLKPYFLQETVTILLDWLRIYLLCGLLFRDWAALLVMTSFFIALMYAQIILFTIVVLRSRRDLRSSWVTVICFPVYRICGVIFRVCALCQNLLIYSHDRTTMKIEKREDEIRDIPPLPPHYIVDWSTVWQKRNTNRNL